MSEDLTTAEVIADFEQRLKIWLRQNYVGIPKPVFSYLVVRHACNKLKEHGKTLTMMESVLLQLTQVEACVLAQGSQLSAERCREIAYQSGLPISSVMDAIDRFRLFWNEGPRLPRKKSGKRKL